MKNMKQHGCTFKTGLVLFVSMLSSANVNAAEKGQVEINDLHFGETLYHFYQGQYFTAISDLLIAKQQHPIKTQGNEPELLLGGLYLSYNMSRPAANIFNRLANTDVDKTVKSSAWYYLARTAYQEGQFNRALAAIKNVGVYLPYRYNDEFLHLQGNTLLKLQKYRDAVKLLGNYSGKTEWSNYAKFNLAIALIKSDEYDRGIALLEEVARIETVDLEQVALKDKANLALGYAALRAKQHEKAAGYFRKIRLSGSQSNKALLGIGWAFHKEGKIERSVVPWLELKNRTSKDSAVQEALLTIPHALEALNAKQQALAYYNDAINTYNSELNSLKSVIDSVKSGEFIHALRSLHQYQQKENHLHYTSLPDSIATPYLQNLIAKERFQAEMKSYRDLIYMQNILQHWDNQIPSYELMLRERKKAYTDRVPRIKSFLKDTKRAQLHKQYTVLKQRAERIKSEFDVFGLANERELRLLKSLDKIKRILDRSPASETEAQRNQYRLFRGILYWDIASEFTPRLWQTTRQLQEVEKSFATLEKTMKGSLTTLVKTPQYFSGFAGRIDKNQQRIHTLKIRTAQAIKRQEALINRMAVDDLNKQRHLLENYHIRASYSLTRLYDSLAVAEKHK